jgi:hypothetical protein
VEITIPKLSEMAYEQVNLVSVPFATFIANKRDQSGEVANYSFVLRGYVDTGSARCGRSTIASSSRTSLPAKTVRACKSSALRSCQPAL